MPIEALQRVDADSVLVFLSANEIAYNTKVDDPWYSSHTPYFEVEAGGSGDPSQNQTNMSYFRDEPASVLGCAIQEQICNPRLPEDRRCTPLAGAYDRDANAAKLVESEEEKFALEWQLWALFYMSTELWVILRTLGSASLASGDSLYDGIQQGLPDNQWQLDVERWHSIMLATLQGQAVDVAEGPPDAKLRAELAKPSNKRERELCKRQRILSTAHSNFSVFFLAFIFTTGGLIILLSWFLETIVAFFQKRRNLDSYSRLEWCTNETLQLQRLAHEELGMGKWEGCDEDVPVKEKGERLAVLDVSDLKHPRLRVRPLGWEEMAAVVVKAERHGGEGNEGIDTGNNTDDGGGGEKGTRCSVEAVEQDGRVSPLSTFAPPRLDDEDTFRAATIAVAPDVNRSGLGNGGSGEHGA
ncbi:hypothetical protein DBV05_g5244 [Lasiodiplodia theobromae]|uniref:Uncharacterized protein n=1 Tax=Lasiodiplodia theobromae TaxID=45133 RepID=A0A5N5DEZ3_9PEZI|nr:hypothetical protein DBV05_g5244 [Lasiodiplodia theobromae]